MVTTESDIHRQCRTHPQPAQLYFLLPQSKYFQDTYLASSAVEQCKTLKATMYCVPWCNYSPIKKSLNYITNANSICAKVLNYCIQVNEVSIPVLIKPASRSNLCGPPMPPSYYIQAQLPDTCTLNGLLTLLHHTQFKIYIKEAKHIHHWTTGI